MSIEQARQIFGDKFRVIFGFDGEETVASNGPGEFRRAVGWGGEESTFTWKRFVTLEDNYNPSPGQLNPWSLKKWYGWGARKFHFHNPFGKVARGKSQQLVYEVDQFLNAKNGLTIGAELQNTKMPWLVNDFVPVIRALTTGQQGTLDQETWDSWTAGKDAWFNPSEPIDIIVYIGSLAEPAEGDPDYHVYIQRWEEHFKRSYTGAVNRLKASVQPLIDANCRIAFDAACVAAGPVPGKFVSLEKQSFNMQKGWWAFWTWINKKIGKDRIYIESHPFRRYGYDNPYLGWNIIADDDWSTSLCCTADPTTKSGPHMTSEMGAIEFVRCLWQGAPTRTPLISRTDSSGSVVPERYYFLKDSETATKITSEYDPNSTEVRLQPPSCCDPGHNYYWHDLIGSIAAYHLLEKQNIRGETNPDGNATKSVFLISNTALQVLPEAYSGDLRWGRQFGIKYQSKEDFIGYVAKLIEEKNNSLSDIYRPR